MARIGIIFGLALCGLTVACLVQSTTKSPYQFIPMILGIPMLFLGVVALNPHRRRQAMNVAASVSTMGLVVGGLPSDLWNTSDLIHLKYNAESNR